VCARQGEVKYGPGIYRSSGIIVGAFLRQDTTDTDLLAVGWVGDWMYGSLCRDGRIGRRSVGWEILGLRIKELVLDLGSEGAEGARGPAWFLVNHLAGLESSCENPEGEEARGNAVVDVVLIGEGSCGLRA
jgi:hypothetical protein